MEITEREVSRPEADGDDWHNVKDAKKRKQIQDKLAQRARRQRLRDAKRIERQTPLQPESQNDHDNQALFHDQGATRDIEQLNPIDSIDLVPCTGNVAAHLPPRSPAHTFRPYEHTPSLSYEIPSQLTLAGALFINGQILGLACCILIPARSAPASPDVPLPLRPTATQLITIHSTSVDRFPFPKMRDNYINMSSLFDEEELTRDLLITPSLSITPGCAPWDPRAWKMERGFADKWGFLFQ